MGFFKKMFGMEEVQLEPIANLEAYSLTIRNNREEQERIVDRAIVRINCLESKLQRQRDKGIEEKYVQETIKEINYWQRQLTYFKAELEQ